MSRPPVPSGMERRIEVGESWRVEEAPALRVTDEPYVCNDNHCQRRAVAVVYNRRGEVSSAWCERHIAPAWIENGRVVEWVLRR